MGWNDAAASMAARAATGRYFKLADDGDQGRLVLLTEPEEVEKDGNNGPYTVFSVEIWNVDAKRKQTWDMTGGPFKTLLGLYKLLGHRKIYASELVVCRVGRKGDTSTTYTWAADGAITDDTVAAMLEQGIAPPTGSPAPAPSVSAGRGKQPPRVEDLIGGVELATTLEEARAAFGAAWADAEGHPGVQEQLQQRFDVIKDKLTTNTVQRRKPNF